MHILWWYLLIGFIVEALVSGIIFSKLIITITDISKTDEEKSFLFGLLKETTIDIWTKPKAFAKFIIEHAIKVVLFPITVPFMIINSKTLLENIPNIAEDVLRTKKEIEEKELRIQKEIEGSIKEIEELIKEMEEMK